VATSTGIRFGTAPGRWVLLATIVGSGMALLDSTVVNVALPAIGKDLGGGVAGLQWVVTAYLITLSSLILIGGSLGDLFGRRRIFIIGTVWFSGASLLCAAAPTLGLLIAARAVQGVGGALLTPGSLAIIEASFVPEDRNRAIGAWSGLGGVATAIGPFVGGWLVSAVSWRLIFLLNLPLAVTVLLASPHVPESRDPASGHRVDGLGAALAAVGLAALTYALIEGPSGSVSAAVSVLSALIGIGGLFGFFLVERSSRHPMLPLNIFRSRQFSAANLVTVAVYAALGGIFFLLAVYLQQVLHYSPVEAGAALFPLTVIMLLLSARAGELAQRIGPRLPMTLGPIIVGIGLLLMLRIQPGSHYVSTVLPSVIVFGLGLSLTVAPLTATVLAAVDPSHAGIASGVNNAVARVAGLLAVALLPALAGLSGADYQRAAVFTRGFHTSVVICAGLSFAGALVAFAGIRNPTPEEAQLSACGTGRSCPVSGPPLRHLPADR
jgi:EmrB/QacA subfamily drug resistance transporter